MRRFCLIYILALALAGCGGNGGSPINGASAAFVAAKVPIGWTQRAREFDGTSSALSVVITLDDAGTSKQNVTLEADRSTTPGAYIQTYTTGQTVQVGVESIHVRFYSLAGGLGNIVAQSDASVTVGPDGTLYQANGSALGSVQAAGTIASVMVSGPATVAVGTPGNITCTAYDSGLNAIALSPGSIFYQIANDTATATINASGQIVGSTAGSISLTATVDGISSQAFLITVTPTALAMTSIAQATNAMIFDAQTGHLWASVPATDPTYGNCVIEIDPVAQKIVTHIPVGSSPTVLAISDDGTALYVGLQGSDSFAQVDPVGKTLVATYPVNPNVSGFGSGSQYATAIAVEPGNPTVVALCQQDEEDSGFVGGCIYKQGVLLPDQLGIYNGDVLAFSSASTLWGSDPGFSPQSLFEGTINSSGATLANTNRGLGGNFWIYGGNLYFNDGQVVSGASGNLLGTFPVTGEGLGATVDLNGRTAYLIVGPLGGGNLEVNSFNTTTFDAIATFAVPAGPSAANGFVLLPSGSFAFEDGTNIYFLSPPTSSGAKVAPRQNSLTRVKLNAG